MTDEKLALLEHITYIDEHVLAAADVKDFDISKGNSVAEILSKFTDEKLDKLRNYKDKDNQSIIDGAFVSGEDWANIIETLKNDPELSQLEVVAAEPVKKAKGLPPNGQICYKDTTTNQGIITYKGTDRYDEWDDNFKGLYEQDTTSQKEALAFFEKYEGQFDDVVLVGHSKGANKAMYVDIVADSDKISRCIAMDGQGFSNKFLEAYKDEISRQGTKITNYSVDSDYVHVLMKQIPNAEQKYCKPFGIKNVLQYHSPFAMFKSENGKMELSGPNNSPVFVNTKNESKEVQVLRDFSNYLMDNCNDKELKIIADYLGRVTGEGIGEKHYLKAFAHLCFDKLGRGVLTEKAITYGMKEMAPYILCDPVSLANSMSLSNSKENTVIGEQASNKEQKLSINNGDSKGKMSMADWKAAIANEANANNKAVRDVQTPERNLPNKTSGWSRS
ncbi:MAG: DUF2974 domain-containing protein [Pseudobutyrivibrio sp.]|nr:DUF2974 domain-containing protein [Pseudobutyrivibrio sp.]